MGTGLEDRKPCDGGVGIERLGLGTWVCIV